MISLAELAGSLAWMMGALAGVGLFTVALGLKKVPRKDKAKKQVRLRRFESKGSAQMRQKKLTTNLGQIGMSAGFALGAWYVTEWIAAAIVGAMAGWMIPMMAAAPARRARMTDEIEAYSQWTEQIRDLVSASGSLFEAVTLSADNAPAILRPTVVRMTDMVRTVGLTPALDWFAEESSSPFADRLVLGIKIAWDSGARVTESFENTANAMRDEVEMRRRNEVANGRAWTQVVSILVVTLLAVCAMFVMNRGFFDPFGTTTGQMVLLGVGGLIFANVFWVVKLSESGMPIRLLAGPEDEDLQAGGQPMAMTPPERT